MYTKELLPIIKEFIGRRCILKLSNGNIKSGAIEEIQFHSSFFRKSTPAVSIKDEKNVCCLIFISNIIALRLE